MNLMILFTLSFLLLLKVNSQTAHPHHPHSDFDRSSILNQHEQTLHLHAPVLNSGSHKEKESGNPKTKWQKEKEKFTKLPIEEQEVKRKKRLESARKFRKNLKKKTGFVSKANANANTLSHLVYFGLATKEQEMEYEQILKKKREYRKLVRIRKKMAKE